MKREKNDDNGNGNGNGKGSIASEMKRSISTTRPLMAPLSKKGEIVKFDSNDDNDIINSNNHIDGTATSMKSSVNGNLNDTKNSLQSQSQFMESGNFFFKSNSPSSSSNSSSSQSPSSSWWNASQDWKWIAYLTSFALIVRLALLHHPNVVIFDEVHFGGFARNYINQQFFTDLHPPLARLLVTLSAWLGGYDGHFSFYDIGANYLAEDSNEVPYVWMRAFPALFGVLTIPLAYITMKAMGVSRQVAALIAALLTIENANITQSRLILLDSYLVWGSVATTTFWWLWRRTGKYIHLVLCGLALGFAASCKWIGLFLVACLGIFTIGDFWKMWKDVTLPLRDISKEFGRRAFALILCPFLVYAFSFWIHFALLTKSSTSAASMSIEFQQTLIGGELPSTMKPLYYGSVVRIRQSRSEGPFLHSHTHLYPAGSKQQQVTGYHHRDQNNIWMVDRPFVVNVTFTDLDPQDLPLEQVKSGDLIRLRHVVTGRFLHSHPVAPPISTKEHQNEVSCYGHFPSKFGDSNDNWKIDALGLKTGTPISAVSDKIMFWHPNQSCGLHSRGKPLPEWGFKQIEITCGRDTLRSNMIWIIEQNEHPQLNMTASNGIIPQIKFKKASFWNKFLEINGKMWNSNAGLSADHPFASRPMDWIFLWRGLGFWNGNHIPKIESEWKRSKAAKGLGKDSQDGNGNAKGGSDSSSSSGGAGSLQDSKEKIEMEKLKQEYTKFKGQQIYLLGNPIVWWLSSLSLFLFVSLIFLGKIAGKFSMNRLSWFQNLFVELLSLSRPGGYMFLVWFLHWIPFFGMNRQLFLHHYLPAFYHSILLFGLFLDKFLELFVNFAFSSSTHSNSSKSSFSNSSSSNSHSLNKWKNSILIAIFAISFWAFIKFSPLSYGLAMSKRQCEALRWRTKWDFDCDSLVDSASIAITSN